MQLDLDYALDILQKVADDEKAILDPDELTPSGADAEMEKYWYHCWLLYDEGLIEVWDTRNLSNPMKCHPKTLTWAGHDFLGTYHPKGIREKVKEAIRSRGLGWSFTTVKTIGPELMRQLFTGNSPTP